MKPGANGVGVPKLAALKERGRDRRVYLDAEIIATIRWKKVNVTEGFVMVRNYILD